MQRRTSIVLLLLAGIIAIIAVLWWALAPVLKKSADQQPPALPDKAAPVAPVTPSKIPTAAKPATTLSGAALQEDQLQNALKRKAMVFAGRFGTYSSVDGFAALRDAQVDATTDLRKALVTQQAALQKDHPPYGNSWGITTLALSAAVVDAPVAGKTSVSLTVQTQQNVYVAGAVQSTSYQEADMKLVKDGQDWRVSELTWKPVQQ